MEGRTYDKNGDRVAILWDILILGSSVALPLFGSGMVYGGLVGDEHILIADTPRRRRVAVTAGLCALLAGVTLIASVHLMAAEQSTQNTLSNGHMVLAIVHALTVLLAIGVIATGLTERRAQKRSNEADNSKEKRHLRSVA